jgi:hypothetical protein
MTSLQRRDEKCLYFFRPVGHGRVNEFLKPLLHLEKDYNCVMLAAQAIAAGSAVLQV